MAKPQPIQPKPQAAATITSLPNTVVTTAASNSVIVVYPALSQPTQSTTSSMGTGNLVPINQQTSLPAQSLYTHPANTNAHFISQQPSVPAVTGRYARDPVIGPLPNRQPIRSFTDIAALHSVNPESHQDEESFYDLTNIESTDQLFGSSRSQSTRPDAALPSQTTALPDWSNDVSINTTLDLTSIIKPKIVSYATSCHLYLCIYPIFTFVANK